MNVLFAFAPFIAFALVALLVGPIAGLFAGAATSIALLVRETLILRRRAKMLELGTFVLFAGMAVYAVMGGPTWSIVGVRLGVDAGLLSIVLLSLVLRQPFTMQYAREQVEPRLWNDPVFIRTNYRITAVWALAFAVLVLADLVLLYLPDVPRQVSIVASVVALVFAFKFTARSTAH